MLTKHYLCNSNHDAWDFGAFMRRHCTKAIWQQNESAFSLVSTAARVPNCIHKWEWNRSRKIRRFDNTTIEFTGIPLGSMNSKRSLDSHIALGDKSTAAAASRWVTLISSIVLTKILYMQMNNGKVKRISGLKTQSRGSLTVYTWRERLVVQEWGANFASAYGSSKTLYWERKCSRKRGWNDTWNC